MVFVNRDSVNFLCTTFLSVCQTAIMNAEMDMISQITTQVIGTAAFFAGVVLLLIELFRRGLSRLSAFSYACFVLSSVLLSSSLLMGVVAIGGLSVLFGILLKCYRRERRRTAQENEDEK